MASTRTPIKRILIIEDSKDMQQIYEYMFRDKSERYHIEFQSNAEEALRRIEEKEFHLIVLDIIMEPIGGDSFFVLLRRTKNVVSLPVLIVTVLSRFALKSLEGVSSFEYLQKPITKDQLFEKIEKLLP